MHISKVFALSFALGVGACGVDTAPPKVGDVGDTSGSELSKLPCSLAREDILASVQGGRRTAIERGFSWYDAQVSYNQQGSHEGIRTDCSGFVSMCWELGSSYTTASFINDTGEWSSLGSFDELEPADAMVYRSGDSGHIVMFVGWNDSAKTEACVLEQASKADDMQFRARTTASLESGGYHAIRATKFGAGGSADDPGADPDPGTDPGSNAACGDGYCDSNETASSCASDCGGGSSTSCGDGYCDYNETASSCASDCGGGSSTSCGDGYCDYNEDETSCSSDCGGSAQQCFCDDLCAEYGDCCSDCP